MKIKLSLKNYPGNGGAPTPAGKGVLKSQVGSAATKIFHHLLNISNFKVSVRY